MTQQPIQLNGCSSLNLTVQYQSQNQSDKFNECCDLVMSCYYTCGAKKRDCDFAFKGCIYGVCKDMEKDPNINRRFGPNSSCLDFIFYECINLKLKLTQIFLNF